MRAALGVLFLVLLFAAASLVQEHWISEVRETLPGIQYQPEREVQAASPDELRAEEGWARVVIGRPSGADPLLVDPQERTTPPGATPLERPTPEDVPPARPADYEITLGANETLSEICVRFYQSGAPRLYERLAQYNDLPNANAIREGQKLFVPPTAELLLSGE